MSKGKNISSHEIEPMYEQELLVVDETKLPLVLAKRLNLLEKTNTAYDLAKMKEKKAREKVDEALCHADELIVKAKGAGSNTAESHSFLWFKWTSTNNEIDTLKANLKEMIDCGIESAEAQKVLVEVQSALADSQTALLQVQETQMAYQRQIADATKFLYGLSAYNMASTQSILINLQAVLSGASKEKLGVMARQQLLLAMDQLKNQENIILRIQEIRNLIDGLNVDISNQDCRIERNEKKNSELYRRIDAMEKSYKEFHIKVIKQDDFIQESIEHNKKQDIEILALVQKDKEHDKSFKEQQNKIDKLEQENDSNTVEIKGLKSSLKQQEQAVTEKNTALDKKYEDTTQQLKDDLAKIKFDLSAEINLIDGKLINMINDSKEEISNKDKDIHNRLTDLKGRIDNLDDITSKMGWKIVISAVAIGSLILNIIQICGILG